MKVNGSGLSMDSVYRTANACRDANGRIINPGDHVRHDGVKHLVDTVDRVTGEVVSMGKRMSCKECEVAKR